MARKSSARPQKNTRPRVKKSPAVTPPPPSRKVELEATPPTADLPIRGKPYPIVGVGASAGGFEAFRELLKALPIDTGLALVLVQHLDPGHESMLAKLLSNATAMPVTEVKEGMAVEPNHVYVIPPNTTMEIRDGTLHLMARGEPAARHLPIDHFLRSLAEDQGSRAIGVILSGTASDGTLGLKAIKAEGGITFAQDIKSAKYDGMPRSAIASGCVDLVLPPEAIASELSRIGRHPYLGMAPPAHALPSRPWKAMTICTRSSWCVQKATGVNFTYYKYSTIKRRIARRMLLHKLESLQQYLQFLHENPAEPSALCEDILIHVTGFFREPEAFQVLAREILPQGLRQQGRPASRFECGSPAVPRGKRRTRRHGLAGMPRRPRQQLAYPDFRHRHQRSSDRKGTGRRIWREQPRSRSPRSAYGASSSKWMEASRSRNRCARCASSRGRTWPRTLRSRGWTSSLAATCSFTWGRCSTRRSWPLFHYALKPTGFLMLGKSESMAASRTFSR